MKKLLFLVILSLTFALNAQVYKDSTAPVESRVSDLVSRMTLEEKINFINGVNWMYTYPIARLGIPSFKMSDGPVGVRTWGKSTAYPASVLSAASWDTDLVNELGVALGKDSRSRGVNFLLGPGVNIARAPMSGRNFEYMGEDPFLASSLVVSYILGVQSQGVVATVKHFCANNQEYDRDNISSDIDERTLQEIYLPAFKAAVQKGKVGAVMNSYNLLNGEHTSENNHLNNEILKGQWGFDGILMSDWGSVHNGIAAFKGGTDLEMPGNSGMKPETILPALASGEISNETLNDKVSRILRICFRFGFFDHPQTIASIPNDDPNSAKVALKLAESGIVLLKNQDNILPLNISKIKKVAFIGPNADTYISGGGSSQTDPFHFVSTLEGFKQLAKNMEVNYTMGIPSLNYLSTKSVFYSSPGSTTIGLKAEYYDNRDLSGTPKGIRVDKVVNNEWVQTPGVEGIGQNNFSVRWTGVIRPSHTSNYKFTVKGDDGYRLWVNNKIVIDYWSDHGFIERNAMLQLEAGKEYDIKLEYYQGTGDAAIVFAWYEPKDENFNEAIKMASEADVAVVCVGFNQQIEHEGANRPFELPEVQDSLIKLVTKANPNTIVVLNAGGNVYMEKWLPSVKGLIHAFYPGQEGGTALAEILLGKINPSGKLPVSFEKKWSDNPTFNNYYDADGDKHVQYKEGLMVGYRYYDTKKVEPLFPFGFGLSYTTFAYSNLKVSVQQQKGKVTATVTFDVKNTGNVDGAEVAQLYISDLVCPVVRPLKELKGFSKVFFKKGETKSVTIKLDESSFSYYKEKIKSFGFDAGYFDILVGGSSKDIKLKKTVKLN
ncbi:MAG: glycoside hydrolase family 3 C-terminal domain-containing protein [Paludibacter sp.]|nr:glycoside hydrolase family 3 C-terminal domain-containing protein [Paludibacter sp.]